MKILTFMELIDGFQKDFYKVERIFVFKLWKRASIPRFSVGLSVCLQHEILDEVACGGRGLWLIWRGGGVGKG